MTRSSNPRMPLTLAAATALMLGLGGHATAQQQDAQYYGHNGAADAPTVPWRFHHALTRSAA